MKTNFWIILGLLSIVAAGCQMPGNAALTAAAPAGPNQVWIDAPLDGSTLQLLPYTVVFHSASHFGVDEFEVKVTDVVEAMVSPLSQVGEGGSGGTLFYGEYLWTPPAPGTYLIAVRALAKGEPVHR